MPRRVTKRKQNKRVRREPVNRLIEEKLGRLDLLNI